MGEPATRRLGWGRSVRFFSSWTGRFRSACTRGFCRGEKTSEVASRKDCGFAPASTVRASVAHGCSGSAFWRLSTEYPRVATLALVGITRLAVRKRRSLREVVHVVPRSKTIALMDAAAGRNSLVCEKLISERWAAVTNRAVSLP